jgi:IS4 transposase
MGRELIDLYSDYLLCSSRQTTATGLSWLTGGVVSHDRITRFLSGEGMDGKTLWLKVKKLVRCHENDDACLIFDDTIVKKPYMDENDIVCWHWDHKENRSVKGINLLTAFYAVHSRDMPVRIPIGYEIIAKTEKYIDEKDNKEKRRSEKTKNELMREMISAQIRNRVKFAYILGDSWFSSSENMKFIDKKGKIFIFEMKENRLAALSKEDRDEGCFERIDQREIPERKPVAAWLKDLSIPIVLYKEVFKNKDGSQGTRYLVTNDLRMAGKQIETLYKRRWGVEEYHKSIKQNASIGSSPARSERTQSNHIFAAIYGYIKLERIKLERKINHFALKTLIYTASLKTAMNLIPTYGTVP